ncbi:uncharacterized protein SOCE26_066270 [Sorangium cellulosum]|uniref:Uncharacterized protein n=1 Tax=Sorangium cellulosum TaxID=56 RepID=A0A2L0F0U0_SORCE|nr:hypothetical protein [Sorangium cellulosum]AUX45146.1 uncharacterized protein SOCE26_066270 [Sorangium cellulosum]
MSAELHYDPRQARLIEVSAGRLLARVEALLPRSGAEATRWMRGIAPGGDLARYFMHPHAFPTLLLPWWLDRAIAGRADEGLQGELAYSSMSGYYFIRLIDDCMDLGQNTRLLPVLGVLHAEFQAAYQRLFPSGDRFWPEFTRLWAHTADAAVADADSSPITLERFTAVSAHKVAAARIPMLAVCRVHGLEALPAAWEQVFLLLSRFHQMHNDLLDWQRDLEHGAATFFLGEAERRRRPGEPVAAWVVREGFAAGMAMLRGALAEMRFLAAGTGSADLAAYVDARAQALAQMDDDVTRGLAALAAICAAQEDR